MQGKLALLALAGLLAGTLAACGDDPAVAALPAATRAAADGAARPSPTVVPAFEPRPLPTAQPLPTVAEMPTAAPEQAAPAERLVEEVVYDEKLSSGWTLDASRGVDVDPADKTRAYTGERSIAVSPEIDFGQLYFSVDEDAPRLYKRDDVVGVSFWINPGEGEIGTSDLAVTVVGSNTYPYWRADDTSVVAKGETFSETRLYYLGFNHAVPPDTWVEVVVWLNELIYDPDYRYVTGIYIKNDEGFRQTISVDRVALLLAPEE